MTDQGKQQGQPQGLTCPLCLSDFKNPTLLRCGHTFCKICLENYDQQRQGRSYMECPVCRKRTKLEKDRIAGLSPNFSLKGLQDELKFGKDIRCSLHKNEDKNIFCVVCEDFICVTCLIKTHQGHTIKSKVELGEELKKQRMALIEESKAGKTKLDEICNAAKRQREEIKCYLKTIKKEIEDAFAKKYTTLQDNENNLIKRVNVIRNACDMPVWQSLLDHLDLIDEINGSVVILRGHESLHLQNNVLEEHRLHCSTLENTLKKIKNFSEVKQQYTSQVQVAMNTKFCPAQDTLLDVGHIKVGDIEQETTTPLLGSSGNKEQAERRNSSTNNSDSTKKRTFGIMLQGGEAEEISQEVEKTAPVTENPPGDKGKGGKVKRKNGKEITKENSAPVHTSTLPEAESTARSSQETAFVTINSLGFNANKGKATVKNGQEVTKSNPESTVTNMVSGIGAPAKTPEATTTAPEPRDNRKGGIDTMSLQQNNKANSEPTLSSGGKAAERSSQEVKTTAPVTVNSPGDKGKGGKGKVGKKQTKNGAKCTRNPEPTIACTLPGRKSEASTSQQTRTVGPETGKSPGLIGNEGKAKMQNGHKINNGNPVSTFLDDVAGNTPSTSSSNPSTTVTAVKINSDKMQPCTRGNVGAMPSTIKNNSLTIVKEVESERYIWGMGALSPSSVVVGHGAYMPVSECCSLSGERKPHLNLKEAYDIACLANGRTAVSTHGSVCHIYNAEGSLDFEYCIPRHGLQFFPDLCSDQHGDIYAVNGDSEIFIFSGSNPSPQTIIPTGKVTAEQVSVAKTGAIILCGSLKRKTLQPLRSVTVYNREGHTGSSIKSSNMMIEYMYAAVDSQDRVLVARVKDRSSTIRLTRYTLQGLTLFKEVAFKPLELPFTAERFNSHHSCSCMVSLSPNMIVFSYSRHLYFIELPL